MQKNPIVVANAYIWHQNRILLLKRSPKRTYGQRSPWNCPGGAVEYGEYPEAAIKREIFEETNLEPKMHGLIHLWTETFPTGIQLFVFSYLGTVDTKKVTINEESTASKWFSTEEALELETFPNFKEGLLKSLTYHKKKEKV
ncbi:NUDIX hydrolase [Patescibacteria group bacterium]